MDKKIDTFDTQRADTAGGMPGKPPFATGGKPRILVIDDDPHVRKTLSDILQVKGYDVVAVKDGSEGITEAQRMFVNLALIDLMLPDIPGIEVMERIRSASALTEAIILTGNASLGTAIEATNKGAFSYLVKPYHMEDLLLHIRRGVERQRTQETVEQLRHQLELVVQSTGEGIVTFDIDCRCTLANPAAARMLGYEMPALIGSHLRDFWRPMKSGGPGPSAEDDAVHLTLQDGQVRRNDDGMFRRKDDTSFPVEYVVSPIRSDRTITGVVMTFLDITERKQVEQEIHALAATDSLTGVANRRTFTELLEGEIVRARRYGTPLALVMYDIDHFKAVNDTHGHDVGDEVLKDITELVRTSIRAADVVARWGGEEFVILVPQSGIDGVLAMAEKLRAAIAGTTFGKAGTVTASFGVTVFSQQDDRASLLKKADDALYKAKANGRNRVEAFIERT